MDTIDEPLQVPESFTGGKREAEADTHPEGANNFQFLTFTDFQQTVDPRTKKKVRSHVMQRVHRTMRSGEHSRNERVIVLDTSSLFGQPAPQQGLDLATISRPRFLGSGRLDPFANFPIPMNMRTQYLFDHLRGDFCPIFRTMTRLGFFQSMTDPAGFRQILCTSASHMEMLRAKPATEAETSEALSFLTQAIQSVNTRLADPVQNKSDGLVGAILAFCCHSIMFQDLKNSITHLNGLEHIIQLRGGLESLETNPVLRMMLFWADTNIAYAEDLPPLFPAPAQLLPPINIRQCEIIDMKLTEACAREDLANAMRLLYRLNRLLIDEALTKDIWDDGVFAELNLMPVLHKLLSIRFEIPEQDPVLIKQETYRIGAINYLAIIRDKFAVNLSSHVPLRKLKDAVRFLESAIVDHDPLVLLWLLVVGGTQSIRKGERPVHDWFVAKLSDMIAFMGYGSWEQIMYHVSGVLWIEGLAQSECEVLRGEVLDKVWTSHGHFFA